MDYEDRKDDLDAQHFEEGDSFAIDMANFGKYAVTQAGVGHLEGLVAGQVPDDVPDDIMDAVRALTDSTMSLVAFQLSTLDGDRRTFLMQPEQAMVFANDFQVIALEVALREARRKYEHIKDDLSEPMRELMDHAITVMEQGSRDRIAEHKRHQAEFEKLKDSPIENLIQSVENKFSLDEPEPPSSHYTPPHPTWGGDE